jgi:hypothetical protein
VNLRYRTPTCGARYLNLTGTFPLRSAIPVVTLGHNRKGSGPMAKHPTKVSWTVEDVEKLASLVESGASPARAAAALNRKIVAVRVKARLIGKPFPPLRIVRKKWQPEPIKPNAMKPY